MTQIIFLRQTQLIGTIASSKNRSSIHPPKQKELNIILLFTKLLYSSQEVDIFFTNSSRSGTFTHTCKTLSSLYLTLGVEVQGMKYCIMAKFLLSESTQTLWIKRKNCSVTFDPSQSFSISVLNFVFVWIFFPKDITRPRPRKTYVREANILQSSCQEILS